MPGGNLPHWMSCPVQWIWWCVQWWSIGREGSLSFPLGPDLDLSVSRFRLETTHGSASPRHLSLLVYIMSVDSRVLYFIIEL